MGVKRNDNNISKTHSKSFGYIENQFPNVGNALGESFSNDPNTLGSSIRRAVKFKKEDELECDKNE